MKLKRLVFYTVVLLGCVGAWQGFLAYERWNRPAPNYTRIEEGLYLGGYVDEPPPGTTAVLNVGMWEDSYQCEHHAWDPIEDKAPAPNLEWLAKQVEFVTEQRNAGRTTYIHCAVGCSRSAMVLCAYLMAKNDWTRDEAIAYLRARRPHVDPNPAFMELLEEWERSQKRSRGR